MDKTKLAEYVLQGLSTYEIAKQENRSHTNVHYWLIKFGLKTKNAKIREGGFCCATCGETDKLKFKNAGKGRRCKSVCSACHNARMSEIFKTLKVKGIEYKGGKCARCGYNKCCGSLHFHHVDPLKKDPNWDKIRHHNWERFKVELDKCELICANCHGEIHWGYGPTEGH